MIRKVGTGFAILALATLAALVLLPSSLPRGGRAEAESLPSMLGPTPREGVGAHLQPAFPALPLFFVENQGQFDAPMDYYIQGADKCIYFGPKGVTFVFFQFPSGDGSRRGKGRLDRSLAALPVHRWTVKLDFLGANPEVHPVGQDPTQTIFSYFRGSPDQWHAGIPTYRRIVYRDLWPGIDLIFSATGSHIKYELLVRPGADPDQIRLAYRGATEVTLNVAGQLEVHTPLGNFIDGTPLAYQGVDGARLSVRADYQPLPVAETASQQACFQGKTYPLREMAFAFSLGPYDSSRPLVIDPPILLYCGYIGGSANEIAWDVDVDEAGNAYVAGETFSTEAGGFPVAVGPDVTANGSWEAFVAKVKADGSGLDYCGFIGGSDWDWAYGVAFDDDGNAYVSGETYSSEGEGFPVLVGPDLTYNGGTGDAFVAKVNAAGTALVYCGYIGGSGDSEYAEDVDVDSAGNAYVTGGTDASESDGFPVIVGPDLTYNGDDADVFVAKVKADGTALDYCGYVGGTGYEYAVSIDVDDEANAYIAGGTDSPEAGGFPVVAGPDLTYNGGDWDAFVAKVKADGTALDYCGYIGGGGYEWIEDVIADDAGNAYVVGWGCSSETDGFPVVVGPDLTANGSDEAFVAKVKADGTALVYCGYVGGSDDDWAYGITIDGAGNAYIAGETYSSEGEGFPVLVGPDLTFNGDEEGFVAKIQADGSALVYCGYIGGSDEDWAQHIGIDGVGNTYVVGGTYSSEGEGFPVLVGPDLTFNGERDIFIAKIKGEPISLPNRIFLPLMMKKLQ